MYYRPPPARPVPANPHVIETAMILARRHLPPAIARIVIAELAFYGTAVWNGLPRGVQAAIRELEAMEEESSKCDNGVTPGRPL